MSQERVALRQRRDLSQIIEGAVSLYMQHFWAFFLIAAVVIPLAIASAAVQETGDVVTFTETEESFDIDVDWTPFSLLIVLSFAQLCVQFIAAMAIVAALRAYAGAQAPDFAAAYDLILARIGTLIGAALRVLIVVVPLAITGIGFPVAIYFGVRWAFFGPAILLDDTSAKASLAFSADAVEGSWWRTLGILIVILLIGVIPGALVAGFFSLAPPIVAGAANSLISAALLPFTMIAATLLYLDLQARKQASTTPQPEGA